MLAGCMLYIFMSFYAMCVCVPLIHPLPSSFCSLVYLLKKTNDRGQYPSRRKIERGKRGKGEKEKERGEEFLCPTLAEMRRDDIDLHILADEAHARRLIAVHAAEARTEIAVPQVRVGLRALLGGVDLGERLVARDVVV